MGKLQLALLKYDLKLAIRKGMNWRAPKPILGSRVPISTVKRFVRARGLALSDGQPSWFYTAYERGDTDQLTNHTLDFIRSEVPKNASLLITGCGTGIMLFHLIDAGFSRSEGFDFKSECVLVANDIAKAGDYHCRIWQADGFNPQLDRKYDVILALHWVFSAWMGNYGNTATSYEQAKMASKREQLLNEFLSQYAPHLNPGGLMIVEVTDAVADYRVPDDGGKRAFPLDQIYPVRFTPEQVKACARSNGLGVENYALTTTGHQPRTSYRLRKLKSALPD